MKDKNIDFRDIPELTEETLQNLKRVTPREFVITTKESCSAAIVKEEQSK